MTHYHLTSRYEALRAAIAINNIGCALLESGRYEQAHQTLQDAARATVLLVGDADSEECRASVASKLSAADRRLALPCAAVAPPPSSSPDSKGEGPAPLRIAFDESNDDDYQDPDVVVLSAIAVHNSALSCYYRSMTPVEADWSPDKRRRLLAKAKVLLKSSYSLIADCPSTGSQATLSCALHILENLHLVVQASDRSGGPDLDVAENEHVVTLEDELIRLRWTARAVEQADRHFFGRPDRIAAAA